MSVLPQAAVALLATSLAWPATAQRIRLDDSLSPIASYGVDLHWTPAEIRNAIRALEGGANALPPMTARIPNVEVRLDARELVGREARIYLRLPPISANVGSPADLELRWEADGAFLAGAVRPGQSTLVFSGVVEAPIMSSVFDFLLVLENGATVDAFVLEPVYEIEIVL